MSDIVERLRLRLSVTKGYDLTDDLAIEAVAEIERLQRELGKANRATLDRMDEIERLQVEIEHLLALLCARCC